MNWKSWLKNAVVLLVSILLFDHLFWQQGVGTNLVIYALFIALLVPLLNSTARNGKRQLIAAAALLYTAVAFLWHGTDLAAVMLVFSVLVFSVFYLEKDVRSVTSVAPQLLLHTVWLPWRLKDAMDIPARRVGIPGSIWRWVKIGFVPVVILAVYSAIYRSANPRFQELTAGLFDGLLDRINALFAEIFTARTLFLAFGAVLTGILLYRCAPDAMATWERKFKDTMTRIRSKRPHWKLPLAMNALEKERKAGILLLILMNALLLIVNIVDITWIWFGFEVPVNFDLKQFVHEGTWLLILSIVMSIAILLYLFRRNQNFHPSRRPLQLLAIGWICQNFILGISVFIRNYHYMDFHGLAHKRIGVVIFLVLVLFGLYSMILKIRDKRSGFYLVMVNSWAAFIVMVLAAGVDWDSRIVKANLAHSNPAEIDIDLYLELDERTLPVVYENLDRVEVQMKKHGYNERKWVRHLDIHQFRAALDERAKKFMKMYESNDYRTHTFDMHRTYSRLSKVVDP